MDSDDEVDDLMGGDVGQRMSCFMRRKKERLEEDEKILEEINVKKRNDPHFRTRRWEGRPPYEMSCWGRMLVHPRTKDPTDSKGGVLFRRRFRVPYPLFEILVEMTSIIFINNSIYSEFSSKSNVYKFCDQNYITTQ